MSQKPIRRKVPDPEKPGEMVSGTVVKIVKAEEPFCYAELEDGTTITARMSFLEAIRIDGRWDKNGAPIYSVTQNGSLVISAPENLMKNSGGPNGRKQS